MCRWTRCEKDSGLTLVELLITMLVTAIILPGMIIVLVSMFRTHRFISVRNETMASTRTAMEKMTREIRVAEIPEGQTLAIVDASPNSITFFSAQNKPQAPVEASYPSQITYSYAPGKGCIQATVIPMFRITNGPLGLDNGKAEKYCLIQTVEKPMFRYFESSTADINASKELAAHPKVSKDDLPKITSVEIDLTGIVKGAQDVGGSELRTRVTMPNEVKGQQVNPTIIPPVTSTTRTGDSHAVDWTPTGGGVAV